MSSLPPMMPALRGVLRQIRSTKMLFSLAVCVMLPGAVLQAQTGLAGTGRAGLISQAVSDSERVVLKGNVHPLATKAADRGAVPDSMPAERMLLILQRSPERERAFEAAIQSLHDRNSASFHKWLTPAQFGAEWGAADSDVAAATAWLESHGFQVKGPTAGRTAIEFSGNAGQIREAFHAEIHSYLVDGELHHANATNPEIPAALAPLVSGVSTLNDFGIKSELKRGERMVYNTTTNSVEPKANTANSKSNTAHPELTGFSSTGPFLLLTPADIATIYNSPIRALNPAAKGKTIDGSGAKIGLVGDSNISVSQNANYRKLFGLSAKAPTVIIDGDTDPGVNADAGEAYLDTEVANGIAPNAQVYLYTAANSKTDSGIVLAALRAINDNTVDILSLSFGDCEVGLGTSLNQFFSSLWEQAAAQGISVTVSTGDSGSAGCDDPSTEVKALYGLQVNGLASTPYNIAVGGTDFAALLGPDGTGTDFKQYVSGTNDPKTKRSALGYIPEVPWNETTSSYPPGPIATTTAEPNPYWSIYAAGGGKSNCAVGDVTDAGALECHAGYPKPSWQSATGVLADHVRDLPDVSLMAGSGVYGAGWAICTDIDTDVNDNPVHDCTPGSDGLPSNQYYLYVVGGTSASAPAFAGMLALVKQSTGERQGQANYSLYHLAQKYPEIFHDVTTGTNAVPCVKGSESCALNEAGYYYLTGYNAGAGYDLATGLGSVDVTAMLAHWASAGLAATATHVTFSPAPVAQNQAITADIQVTSAAGIPTGDVALTIEPNPPAIPLGEALGTFTLRADGTTGPIALGPLPIGSYTLVASYAGSATLAASVSAPTTLTVTTDPSTTVVTISMVDPETGKTAVGNTTIYGHFIDLEAQVHGTLLPKVVPAGTVTFTASGRNLGVAPLNTKGIATKSGVLLTAGSYVVSAAYSGDSNFKPSTGADPLTVAKAKTTIAITSNATEFSTTPVIFKVKVTTDSLGLAPTGVVQLKSGTTLLGEGKLEGVAGSEKTGTGTTTAIATVSISTEKFDHVGTDVEAVYEGDANYVTSTSNTIEIKTQPSFVLSGAQIDLPGEHSTGGGNIVANSIGGYGGKINLTCALATATKSSTPPLCGFDPAHISIASGATGHTLMLIYGKGTKLPTGVTPGNTSSLRIKLGAGGAVLACCLLLGIPARKSKWRSMLSILLLLAAVGGFAACSSTPKMISAGLYEFKVTGTDAQNPHITQTAIVKVEVF